MLEPRFYCQTVAINSDIFVFGGYSRMHSFVKSAKMLWYENKAWKNIDLKSDNLKNFCVCSFSKKLYIIGRVNANYLINQETYMCKV